MHEVYSGWNGDDDGVYEWCVLERTSINKLSYELCVDCALTYIFHRPHTYKHMPCVQMARNKKHTSYVYFSTLEYNNTCI